MRKSVPSQVEVSPPRRRKRARGTDSVTPTTGTVATTGR